MPAFKKKCQTLDSYALKTSIEYRTKKGTLDYATALTVGLNPHNPAIKKESDKFKAKVEADRKRLGLD